MRLQVSARALKMMGCRGSTASHWASARSRSRERPRSRSTIHSAAFSSMAMSSRSADMRGGILGYRNAGTGDTMGAEELAAANQADRELGVDGAFRDAEAFGNRAMRESLN